MVFNKKKILWSTPALSVYPNLCPKVHLRWKTIILTHLNENIDHKVSYWTIYVKSAKHIFCILILKSLLFYSGWITCQVKLHHQVLANFKTWCHDNQLSVNLLHCCCSYLAVQIHSSVMSHHLSYGDWFFPISEGIMSLQLNTIPCLFLVNLKDFCILMITDETNQK